MKKLLYLAVATLLVFGIREWRYRANLQPLHQIGMSKEVYIAPGSSVTTIAEQLQEDGVIRSDGAFKRYVQSNDLQNKLQAGTYVLNSNQSVAQIVSSLQNATAQEVRVTIPEGFTVHDIDELLTEKGLTQPGEFTECAQSCDFSRFSFLPNESSLDRGGKVEGYLFPDTYFVSTSQFEVQEFMERLLQTFEQKVVNAYTTEIEQSDYSVHQIITMASMVEKETRTDDERSVVAGILWKRLEEGITLGVDATVRYFTNKDTAPLTRTDLDTSSPYNTRNRQGLPPGPIANPSLESIEATLNPESSSYYYYLHGTDGQIRYARTNDEHNANKARYLQ